MEACQQFVEKNDREPVVACMGLAFKPNIDDLRESPAKYIASRIVSESRAEVLIVEPNVASHASFHLTDYREAYQKADIRGMAGTDTLRLWSCPVKKVNWSWTSAE